MVGSLCDHLEEKSLEYLLGLDPYDLYHTGAVFFQMRSFFKAALASLENPCSQTTLMKGRPLRKVTASWLLAQQLRFERVLRESVQLVAIHTLSPPIQEDLMKWIFLNEDRVWR